MKIHSNLSSRYNDTEYYIIKMLVILDDND